MVQQSVSLKQAFAVVGEFYDDSPRRAAPFMLDSTDAANNVIGRVFSIKSEGVAQAGGAGAASAGTLAGILVNPKRYASFGTSAGGPLAASLTLANGTNAEFATMGHIVVTVPGDCAIGDAVKFNTTTGVIGTGAPGGGEAALPNATVFYYDPTQAGLAVISITN